MLEENKIYGQKDAAIYIGSSQAYVNELVKKNKLHPDVVQLGNVKMQIFNKKELNIYITKKKKSEQ